MTRDREIERRPGRSGNDHPVPRPFIRIRQRLAIGVMGTDVRPKNDVRSWLRWRERNAIDDRGGVHQVDRGQTLVAQFGDIQTAVRVQRDLPRLPGQ